ncbi:MAG: preprotein translocase subunit SecE [Phycisphaeraceae bacterium]|nr:preprotein translocase subunit SecE [Phycisphaeraceae bacterium]
MALGIHKPGQGYWVRVLTATGVGVITLAAAAWSWNQMKIVADKLPKTVWAMTLAAPSEEPKVGETVALLGAMPATGEQPPRLGTARISEWIGTAQEARFTAVTMESATVTPISVRQVRSTTGEFRASVPQGGIRGLPPVPPALLQGGIASLVLLGGAVIAYWFCALKPRSSEFLIATDMEMKKVHWSTFPEIRGQTIVVIVFSLLVAAFLFTFDLGFQAFFRGIGVLKTG